MIITVQLSDLSDAMHQCGRSSEFTDEALGLILDYIDETNPTLELSCMDICRTYSESTIEQLRDNYDDCPGEDEEYEEDEEDAIIEWLSDNTSYVGKTSKGYVYADF
jgi:folate-dependent tRNA-U54 methylase TrmFO/GidA